MQYEKAVLRTTWSCFFIFLRRNLDLGCVNTSYLGTIISLGDDVQIIVGITVKDTDMKNEIDKLSVEKYTVIPAANKAFQQLENN